MSTVPAGWELIPQRDNKHCVRCGTVGATNRHHRKNRSQGGQYAGSNGILLCGSGTTGCHGWVTSHPDEAKQGGWSVDSYRDPALVPVLCFWRGWILLRDDLTIRHLTLPLNFDARSYTPEESPGESQDRDQQASQETT